MIKKQPGFIRQLTLFYAIYYAFAFLFLEKLRQFSIRNDKKMQQNTCCELAICIKANCVLHQNAAHLASKRSAFSNKTQCIQHQNAVHLVPKSKSLATSLKAKDFEYYCNMFIISALLKFSSCLVPQSCQAVL